MEQSTKVRDILETCKNCKHSREDHKGTAMICMKQIGDKPDHLCDCNRYDDGKVHVLPIRRE